MKIPEGKPYLFYFFTHVLAAPAGTGTLWDDLDHRITELSIDCTDHVFFYATALGDIAPRKHKKKTIIYLVGGFKDVQTLFMFNSTGRMG